MESRSLEGGALMHLPLEGSLVFPNRKNLTLHTYLSRRKEELIPPCPAIALPVRNLHPQTEALTAYSLLLSPLKAGLFLLCSLDLPMVYRSCPELQFFASPK